MSIYNIKNKKLLRSYIGIFNRRLFQTYKNCTVFDTINFGYIYVKEKYLNKRCKNEYSNIFEYGKRIFEHQIPYSFPALINIGYLIEFQVPVYKRM
jgi:hypothetical protein